MSLGIQKAFDIRCLTYFVEWNYRRGSWSNGICHQFSPNFPVHNWWM